MFLAEKVFIEFDNSSLLSCVFLVLLFSPHGETRTTCIEGHISMNLCGDKPGNNAEDPLLRGQNT